MDKKLQTFVCDNLYLILGYSESNIEQYIVSLAKQISSNSDPIPKFLEKLKQANIPINEKTTNFAKELLEMLPTTKKSITKSLEEERKQEKLEILKKNQSFEILPEEKKKKRKLRKKEEEEEENPVKIAKNEEEEEKEDLESKEEERLKDQKEKEEFEQRMKEKMKKEQSKSQKPDKIQTESQVRKEILTKYKTESEKQNAIQDLRGKSRSKYLDEREKLHLEILEQEIREMKQKQDLKESEKVQLKIKQDALDIRKKDRSTGTEEKEFYIPEVSENDKKNNLSLLKAKTNDKGPVTSDNQEWEKVQMGNINLDYFKNENTQRDGKEYNLIFDEIEFIAQEMIKGEKDMIKEKKEESNEEKTIKQIQEGLPIYQLKKELLQAIDENQILILVGETGSGKSTQLVQYLKDEGYCKNKKKIACTQPRRVAAMSLASRVAQECGVKVGNEVGYSIRFESCVSDKTQIEFMTDGMMLRQFLMEPDMASYSVIIVDEAHERSLHTDILFGLVKDVARFRKDIKLIISSATLEAKKFSEYFDGAPVFFVPGRRYPVDILYTKAPENNYLEAAVITVLHCHFTQPEGDILVFLTGQEEIEAAEEMLTQKTKGLGSKMKELKICPIYSTLPSEMQIKIFEKTPKGARKVVLATNIAETSLTIPNIVYVIDCGYCKQTSYNPRTGVESLVVVPISKAAANQRAGRSGRTAPGKCFRLYTKWSYHNELEENQVPEIQRTNLATVVLMLKSLGIHDLIHFDFMDSPPVETLISSLEHLYALGALNDQGGLTKLGRKMAELPLDPMLSKMLLASEKFQCSEEIITICAMLSVNNSIFYRPKEKAVHADNARKNLFIKGGDHLTLLNVYNEWAGSDFSTNWCYQNYIQAKSMKRAREVREQLLGLMERVEVNIVSNPLDTVQIRKAITAGFFYHTASLQKNGVYKTFHKSQSVHIHPSSSIFEDQPKWVVYFQLAFTTKEFMRQIIEIDPKWLVEIAPHIYKGEDLEKKKMPKGKGRGQMTE